MSEERSKKLSWGVVGGGILGISLALHLALDGHSVTLFEAESSLGGLVKPYEEKGMNWDRYYHVFIPSDTYSQKLLKDINLFNNIKWVRTKSGFFSGDGFYSLSNIWEFIRFPLLGFWSKLRLGLTIFLASRINNPQKIEKKTVEEWLIRWSGKAVFHKIWLPLLRAKLGEAFRETSASFIQATISRMYSARNNRQKQEKFGYVPGGYTTILDHLDIYLKEAGVHTKTSYPVKKVEITPDSGVAVFGATGEENLFDRVVLTVPSPLVATLCPDLSEKERARLAQTPFLGIICVSFLVKDPLSGFYITNIADPRIPFAAVIEMTALMNRDNFSGHSLVYLPKYVSSLDPLFDAAEEDLKQKFIQAFLGIHDHLQPEDIKNVRLAKNRYVFSPPQSNGRFIQKKFRTSIPGLYTANSSFVTEGTLNVNRILSLSKKVFREISSDTK